MTGFEYPTQLHARRHGPEGYQNYESYRDWLRDEFIFRCVYCLLREKWYGRGAAFHIDHGSPVAQEPNRKCDYKNLFYACATCNEAKRAIQGVPNPTEIAFGNCLRVNPDGQVEALNAEGEKLRQVLRLNSKKNVSFRSQFIRTLSALKMNELTLYQEYMSFPEDLPDLRTRRVPSNTKPEGAQNCYFVLRERKELPATY